jgi:hypothetical protein
MFYLPSGLSDSCLQFSKNKGENSQKNYFSFYPPPPCFSILSLLFHISFIHPVSLPSSFHISPRSFLSFSRISLNPFHIMLNCFFLHIAHSAPSFLFFCPIPIFSLLVPTSISCHHFSFFCTLSSQVLRNFLCHTPLILPVVSGFFDFLLSFLLVCIFVTFTQPSSFCPSSPWFFLSKISLVSCSLFFHPICLQTLPLSLTISVSAYFSYTLPSQCTWCFSVHS